MRDSWTFLFLSFAACIFAAVSLSHCSFLITTRDTGEEFWSGLFTKGTEYWSGDIACVPILEINKGSEKQSDAKLVTAQVTGLLTLALTFLALCNTALLHFFTSFKSPSTKRTLGRLVQGYYALSTVTQLLSIVLAYTSVLCRGWDSYVLPQEDYGDCKLGYVGILASINAALLAVIFIASIYRMKSQPESEQAAAVANESNRSFSTHWLVALVVSILLSASVLLSIFHCSFVVVNQAGRRKLQFFNFKAYHGGSDLGTGLFNQGTYDDTCTWGHDPGSDNQQYSDVKTTAAQAFGALTVALSLLAMALIIALRFSTSGRRRVTVILWSVVRVCYGAATITDLATVITARTSDLCNDWYLNDPFCYMGPAGFLACGNIFLLAGMFVYTSALEAPFLASLDDTTNVNDDPSKDNPSMEDANVTSIQSGD